MFLILRKIAALQHAYISYCKIKLQPESQQMVKLKRRVSAHCQFHCSQERVICNKWDKKISTSPWKQAFSPVACAQPDK